MLMLHLFALLVKFWILYLIFNKKYWFLIKRVIYWGSTLKRMKLELTENNIKALLAKLPQLKSEIQKVIVGQDAILDELLVAFLAGGHCLAARIVSSRRCHPRNTNAPKWYLRRRALGRLPIGSRQLGHFRRGKHQVGGYSMATRRERLCQCHCQLQQLLHLARLHQHESSDGRFL